MTGIVLLPTGKTSITVLRASGSDCVDELGLLVLEFSRESLFQSSAPFHVFATGSYRQKNYVLPVF